MSVHPLQLSELRGFSFNPALNMGGGPVPWSCVMLPRAMQRTQLLPCDATCWRLLLLLLLLLRLLLLLLLAALADQVNMIVLCHFAEGRVLLTDQDGLYNSFLVAAASAVQGNVFVVVTGTASLLLQVLPSRTLTTALLLRHRH